MSLLRQACIRKEKTAIPSAEPLSPPPGLPKRTKRTSHGRQFRQLHPFILGVAHCDALRPKKAPASPDSAALDFRVFLAPYKSHCKGYMHAVWTTDHVYVV